MAASIPARAIRKRTQALTTSCRRLAISVEKVPQNQLALTGGFGLSEKEYTPEDERASAGSQDLSWVSLAVGPTPSTASRVVPNYVSAINMLNTLVIEDEEKAYAAEVKKLYDEIKH
ncbi:hypothetical protein ACH5RR_025410 [Cinchona calisaya]|uniref:Uncharacterized protein n=1 Tax=Cinchona calisaya TaxID=153742 RepID=A0ABD2Z0N6_9GENT